MEYDYNRGRADGARQMLEFIRGEDLALRQQGKAGISRLIRRL